MFLDFSALALLCDLHWAGMGLAWVYAGVVDGVQNFVYTLRMGMYSMTICTNSYF
jgi:hypothetical protein